MAGPLTARRAERQLLRALGEVIYWERTGDTLSLNDGFDELLVEPLVVREGEIVGWDGATIAEAPPLESLNFGVNFPGDRGSTPEGRDAGPYPGSEPEVASYVAAVAELFDANFGE